MKGLLKEQSIPALIIAVVLGIIIGSYLNSIVLMLPGGPTVVKTFFTYSVPVGVGDFVHNKPLLIDLGALKFQLGFQLRFSLMSLIGLIVSLYLLRWYR